MTHDLDIDTKDLDWTAAQQPQRIHSDPFVASDPFARERALRALAGHIDSGRGRLGLRRLLRPRTFGLAAAAMAVALLAVVLLTSGGSDSHSAAAPAGSTARVATAHAGATGGAASHPPLMKLADYVSESPTPTGNSTLVRRTTTSEGETETVFDLYGDDGRYVFSPTKEGLAEELEGNPAALAAGEDGDGGTTVRELAAAEAADSGDVRAGAEEMARAPMPSDPYHPGDAEYANRVWEYSQDAIVAGAGRPEIRAGVLKILGTLEGVTVTEGTADGAAILVLSAGPPEMGADYTERLTIDAETGMPIRFTGGPTQGPPLTEVEYEVSRADYPALSPRG